LQNISDLALKKYFAKVQVIFEKFIAGKITSFLNENLKLKLFIKFASLHDIKSFSFF